MPVTTRTKGDVTMLDFKGKLVIGVGDVALRQAVTGALDNGATKLVLNLAGAATIDSCGIGELVSSYTSTSRRGGKLILLRVTAKIMDMLAITQLITIFQVYDTEAEAVASF